MLNCLLIKFHVIHFLITVWQYVWVNSLILWLSYFTCDCIRCCFNRTKQKLHTPVMSNAFQNRAYCLCLYRGQHFDSILALMCTGRLKYTTVLFTSAEAFQLSKCLNLVTWCLQYVAFFLRSEWPLYTWVCFFCFVLAVNVCINIETQYCVLYTFNKQVILISFCVRFLAEHVNNWCEKVTVWAKRW